MSGAFYGCSSLTNVDALVSWDTGSMTNMNHMFDNCRNLTNVDGLALIFSILVDTFLPRISLTMLPAPNLHNTSCVLS